MKESPTNANVTAIELNDIDSALTHDLAAKGSASAPCSTSPDSLGTNVSKADAEKDEIIERLMRENATLKAAAKAPR